MDSKDSNESRKKRRLEESEPIDVPGTSTSNESAQLPLWVAGGSPAKFVAPNELLKMSAALDNLSLVHEIAIDPNFVVPEEPKDPIEAAVKKNLFKAYWDLLRVDLAKEPPVYEHALNLCLEAKQIILTSLVSDRHIRIRNEINRVIDENTLRNRLEEGCLDVHQLGKDVLNILQSLCAPVRDEKIRELMRESDLVNLIKGVFEVVDLMKSDMANYELSQNRSVIESYSAQYELEEFKDHLAHHSYSLQKTEEWIFESFKEIFGDGDDESQPKRECSELSEQFADDVFKKAISRAYAKLVMKASPSPFPETFVLDRHHLSALSEKFLQLVVVASSILITCNSAGKQIADSEGFKKALKDHVVVITNDITTETLDEKLGAVGEQCAKETKETAEKLALSGVDDVVEAVKSQIRAMSSTSNPIRSLVEKRLVQFVEEILQKPDEEPQRLLPGLSNVQAELYAFCARFLRICNHNRKTFRELYELILLKFQKKRWPTEFSKSSLSQTYDALVERHARELEEKRSKNTQQRRAEPVIDSNMASAVHELTNHALNHYTNVLNPAPSRSANPN